MKEIKKDNFSTDVLELLTLLYKHKVQDQRRKKLEND